jgi:hypothetical protein
MKYIISILFLTAIVAKAQSFTPGIPLPGLPKSLGPKPMSGSTSVTVATNQTPIPISGSITANNASVTTNYVTAAGSSTLVAFIDSNGNQHPFAGNNVGITVFASQNTSPWIDSIPGGVAITNTPTVNQGTSPWVISGGVAITNTPTVNQGTSPWVISGGVAITNTPTVNQGTNPWISAITGTVTSQPVTVTVSTVSRVANSLANQTLLGANGSRKSVFLYNDSTATNCYVKFGATASLVSFTIKLFSTDTYIMDPPIYTGVIDYICDVAAGSMEVNEQ